MRRYIDGPLTDELADLTLDIRGRHMISIINLFELKPVLEVLGQIDKVQTTEVYNFLKEANT